MPNIEQKIERLHKSALMRGRQINKELSTLFGQIGFDDSLVAGSGVLSIDVDNGAEIEAFKGYTPRLFLVSEQLSSIERRDEIDREARLAVYRRLQGDLDLRVVDGYSHIAMDALENGLKTKVGLVTMLRPYPQIGAPYIESVVQRAPRVLVEGGVMIISTFDTYIDEILEPLAEKNMDGLDLKYIPAGFPTGDAYLVAQVKKLSGSNTQ
jgi:hypothetical protein